MLCDEYDELLFYGGWLLFLSYELVGEIELWLVFVKFGLLLIVLVLCCFVVVIVDYCCGEMMMIVELGYEVLLDCIE